MADWLRKPLARSLNDLSVQRARDAIHLQGKSLPAHVVTVISSGIVVVEFDVNAAPFTLSQVTVPIEYPEYIRYPIQVGDKGMVMAADARLGTQSGLGTGGPPDLTPPANLGGLSFLWLGSTAWTPAEDARAVVIYGPNGVVLRDTTNAVSLVLTPSGVAIKGNVTVTGTITSTGDMTAAGTSVHTHHHSGVTTGSGNTGAPV